MFGLLKNEFEKMIFKRKFIVTLICLLLLSGLISFGIYKNKKAQEKYSNPSFIIENLKEDIKRIEMDKEAAPQNQKEQFNMMIADMEKQIEELKLQLNTKKPEWKEALKEDIKRLEESKASLTGPALEVKGVQLDNQIQRDKYFLDNNIKPRESFNLNAYDITIELMSILGMLFIILLAALLSADIVSGEYTPPTMKVLLTRPVSRVKILLSKYITAIVSTVLAVVFVELLVFLVSGLIFGFGDSLYPMAVGTRYKYNPIKSAEYGSRLLQIAGSTYIIPIWKFLLESILMQVVYIVSIVSFFFLLSTVLKSSMISMAVGILGSIGLLILTQTGLFSKISPYLFIVYGDTPSILTGDVIRRINNPASTPAVAITVLLAWTVVCYISSHVVFKKRDLLI